MAIPDRLLPFYCHNFLALHIDTVSMTGMVLKSTGSFYQVIVEDKIFQCRIKGKLRLQGMVTTNPVTVGDKVLLEPINETEAMIVSLVPRTNYLVRKSTNLSKQAHVVAANIDIAFLIVTVNYPPTSYGFIDRFLVTCEAYGIPVNLVINKVDLYNNTADENRLEQMVSIYDSIGYPSILTSTINESGLSHLREIMVNKINLLSGNSGVGKSSLINALYPHLNTRTGEISDYHQKGQHTTTFAEMFPLPDKGYLVDTPGIKGFGLLDFEKSELALYFPEMKGLLDQCKFYNCKHISEPGCAVKEALQEGNIPSSRYNSYLGMMADDEGPYR